MKTEKPLSDLYRLYIAGDMSKKDFEGRIFQYLLENFGQYHVFDRNRDRWDEFLSWLYPRLVSAIDRYRDMGSSFDAYIAGLVYSASREYRCREVNHYMTESICWQAKAEEMMLYENEAEYSERRETISLPGDIKPRQILMLLLKSYHFVSDEYVNQVARSIGMESKELLGMVTELRKRRSGREAEILKFRERVYCQHYRCLAYQKRMSTIQPGTEYHAKMKDRFERARRTFIAMRKRLKGMRLDVSNRMIADIIGIPKGTVDSGLFAIKNRLTLY